MSMLLQKSGAELSEITKDDLIPDSQHKFLPARVLPGIAPKRQHKLSMLKCTSDSALQGT